METEIRLTEDFAIPYGNAAAIFSASGKEQLYQRFIETEQALKTNYTDFAHKQRNMLEEFILIEESERRLSGQSITPYALAQMRKTVTQEIKNFEYTYPEKASELLLLSQNRSAIEQIIQKEYAQGTIDPDYFKEKLKETLRTLFKFSSVNSHAGAVPSHLEPDDGNCRKYLKLCYELLNAYYGGTVKYDGGKLPFKDFYPVSKTICKEHGIFLPNGKQLFVRNGEKQTEYYIFTSADEQLGDTQKRDIETIHKLWMDNIETPQNILDNIRFDSGACEKYHYWISQIPSFPQSLTDEYIASLDMSARKMIARGIVRGVRSMHTAQPPFYHRALSASSF